MDFRPLEMELKQRNLERQNELSGTPSASTGLLLVDLNCWIYIVRTYINISRQIYPSVRAGAFLSRLDKIDD